MPLIDTSTLLPGVFHPDNDQLYNGLDVCLTEEVFQHISGIRQPLPLTYGFARALQAPAMEMMCRGFLVDEYERRKAMDDPIDGLRARIARLQWTLNHLAAAVWGKPLNPKSPKQMLEFFYGAMRLPEQWTSKKGVRKLSMDRETLEKLEIYFHARPIIAAVLAIRDLSKQLNVLETEVDGDGRMRTSYNIAGTETGRWSSSTNAFGTGTNLQNIKRDDDIKLGKLSLRKMFVADPGYKLVGIDLEQAESREVGWLMGTLFNEWSYLDACEAGDLHTTTCKLIWPDLGWTGDPKQDRAIAECLFYRNYTYRDMSKRGGHGCLTAEHEVLTRNGWVSIADKPSEILAWGEKFSQFETVSHWIDKEWTGEFTKLQGASISIEATSDHRLIYRTNEQNSWKEAPFGKLPKSYIVPLGWGYVGGNENVSPLLARLIAAFQCDGCQSSRGVVNFQFKKERKKERIAFLAAAAGVKHKLTERGAYIYASNWPKEAGSYLLTWPRESISAYIDEHRYWDGHQDGEKVMISSARKNHLDWLLTVGRLVGVGGYMDKPHVSGFGSLIYRISQNNRNYAAGRQIKVTKQVATKQVYCPTVASGAFYVRHEGKISITGNSNYFGQPFTMARHLKVPTKLMVDFQASYFSAYPLPKWHRWTAQQLQTVQQLTTVFGRQRHFFGRPNDDATLREAIAYSPQSSTGDRLNLALWRIWRYMGTRVQLLAQVHDALYFQFPEGQDEKGLIEEALHYISTPLTHKLPNGTIRRYDVPGEAKVGWNWGTYDPTFNPDGLRKFGKGDDRRRSSGLNRIM